MSRSAWIGALVLLAAAFASALAFGLRAHRAGELRAGRILRAPATWLFVVYLLGSGLLVPTSEGETASPIVGLALALPVLAVLASVASLGAPKRIWARGLLAIVFGAAMLAAGAVTLAIASPRFVPVWLR